MGSDRGSIVAEILFFFGALLLGAAVGVAAFLFALDKYIAIYPVPVPVEVEKPCTPMKPDLRNIPKLHT